MTTSPAAFALVANELCSLIETTASPNTTTYRALARLLAEICALAFELPEVEPSARKQARLKPVSLALSFGEDNRYHEIFDAYADGAAVEGSLADDLSDIHTDLANGLAILRRGTPEDERDAMWEWRFGFYSHWGEHATSALRALYWLLRRAED